MAWYLEGRYPIKCKYIFTYLSKIVSSCFVSFTILKKINSNKTFKYITFLLNNIKFEFEHWCSSSTTRIWELFFNFRINIMYVLTEIYWTLLTVINYFKKEYSENFLKKDPPQKNTVNSIFYLNYNKKNLYISCSYLFPAII